MRSTRWLWLMLITVLALVPAACGRDEEGGGGGGGAAADPGITDKEIKLGGSYPFSGPASAYGTIGEGAKAYFEFRQRQGRRRRPQDQVQDARRRLRAPAGAAEREAADPAGQGLRALQHARDAEQPRDLGLRQPAEGAAPVRRHRRVGLGQGHRGAPVHDRLAAELRDRGQGLRGLPQEGEAEGEGRGALPERRLRQGPARRLRGGDRGLRRQGRRQGALQRHRPDRRGAGRPARALGGGHVPEHHDAEVLGPGDRDDRQERLEAAAHPQQRRRLEDARAQAGRARRTPRGSSRRTTSRTPRTRSGPTTRR